MLATDKDIQELRDNVKELRKQISRTAFIRPDDERSHVLDAANDEMTNAWRHQENEAKEMGKILKHTSEMHGTLSSINAMQERRQSGVRREIEEKESLIGVYEGTMIRRSREIIGLNQHVKYMVERYDTLKGQLRLNSEIKSSLKLAVQERDEVLQELGEKLNATMERKSILEALAERQRQLLAEATAMEHKALECDRDRGWWMDREARLRESLAKLEAQIEVLQKSVANAQQRALDLSRHKDFVTGKRDAVTEEVNALSLDVVAMKSLVEEAETFVEHFRHPDFDAIRVDVETLRKVLSTARTVAEAIEAVDTEMDVQQSDIVDFERGRTKIEQDRNTLIAEKDKAREEANTINSKLKDAMTELGHIHDWTAKRELYKPFAAWNSSQKVTLTPEGVPAMLIKARTIGKLQMGDLKQQKIIFKVTPTEVHIGSKKLRAVEVFAVVLFPKVSDDVSLSWKAVTIHSMGEAAPLKLLFFSEEACCEVVVQGLGPLMQDSAQLPRTKREFMRQCGMLKILKKYPDKVDIGKALMAKKTGG